MANAPQRRPEPLTWASRSRILSIHEGTIEIDARASTFMRRCIPMSIVSGTREYHAFDVVIRGDNPVLAALLLRAAVDRGLDAAVTLPSGDDAWPYDLALSREGGSLVSAALGSGPRSGAGSVASLVRTALKGLPPTRVTVLGQQPFLMSDKHPDGELTLYAGDGAAPAIGAAERRDACAEFAAALGDYPAGRNLGLKRTAYFAKRLVLTARPERFVGSSMTEGEFGRRIDWGHQAVWAVGTAATDAGDGRDEAGMMVDDLIRCSRGLPLVGIRPASLPQSANAPAAAVAAP
jgi:hypothetical protein